MGIPAGIIETAMKKFPKGGTILEFGVASGSSYIQLASKIIYDKWPCVLIGFDSWQGLPKEIEGVHFHPSWQVGAYAFSRQIVENKIKKLGVILPDKRFQFVDGWLENSLTKELQQSIKNLIFVNIDIDLYVSTVVVLNFLTPILQKGTQIYFDDWYEKAPELCGERLALKQWTEKNPEKKYSFIYKTEQVAVIEIQ